MRPAAIRAGGYQGAASVHTRAMRAFGEALSGPTAPSFSLLEDVTRDGSPATDLLARVEAGALDLCYFASSYLAGRVPALLALDIPFTFSGRESAYHALGGELGRMIAADVAARTGFVVLALWDNGFRHLSNRLRPVICPGDCGGMTIRTLDNRLHQAVFRSFGFRPVMIDVRDLASSVQEGRVDAQENPLTNTVNFGLHPSHRYHSLTGHLFGVALLLANQAWYRALPDAARAHLDRAVVAATEVQRRAAQDEDARCLTVLEADGAEVVWPDRLQLPAFRDAAAPVREGALGTLDPALRAALGA